MGSAGFGAVAKRYAPFALLAVAQLIIVLAAPSVGPTGNAAYGGGAGPYAAAPGAGGGAAGAGGSAGATADGPSGKAAVGGGSSGGAQPGSASRGGGAGAQDRGDTSHCVDGRQFGFLESAPPCQPKWTGGDNGGATYQGVSATSVKVVFYRPNYSPAVRAILQQMGVWTDPEDQKAFLEKAENVINKYYELYGRKVDIIYFQGSCSVAPPEESCYRQDAKRIVQTQHPFAVMFENNTNAPWFQDQLSRLGVVNLGGWHFFDEFSRAQRPLHYDALMGGQYQAELAGEYWCKKLAGHRAQYAGDAALQQQQRKTAIIVQENELNRASAEHLKSIIDRCDPNGAIIDTYAADTTTAASQSTSAIARFKQEGITSVLWFSDPVAPVYFTQQCTQQNYFPEHVLVGSGLLDYDAIAQRYDQRQWRHAFGPSDIADWPGLENTDGAAVWRRGGGEGRPPYDGVDLPWSYLAIIAAGVQQAGPNLNPATFERGVLTLPATGGSRYEPLADFGRGDYTAASDAREVYWDPNATSPINGERGAYVSLNNGKRYTYGEWPSGEPNLPIGG